MQLGVLKGSSSGDAWMEELDMLSCPLVLLSMGLYYIALRG